MPEVVGEGGIVVDPDDTEAVARAMSELVMDEFIRRQWIERAHLRVSEFSWHRTARELVSLWKALD